MSPDSAHEVISIKVEDGVDVGTEEQVIPLSILFSPLKADQDKVSYMSLCPVLDSFTQYSVMPAVLCGLCLPNNSNVMNENVFLFWVMGICSKEICK
jgi:hypothetical protein